MKKKTDHPSSRNVSSVSRREFLKTATATLALAALPGTGFITMVKKHPGKMILSFYMDDTNPEVVKADAFKEFLGYCRANGIHGESSFIPGYNGKSIIREHDPDQEQYLEQVKTAWSKGIDTHMELMTHHTLFDFDAGKAREDGIHEGLWLHEPGVTMEEYRNYFSGILSEAGKSGIQYTGLTWPGCGCPECTRRYNELRSSGPLHINQAAFDAMLSLAREGRFRGRVLPVFYESSEGDIGIFRRAAEGKFGVYDLQPNAEDHYGIWENSKDHVNADYYINADGSSGILLKHLKNKDPYCLWYMHWQGVNPGNGVGWEAFTTVTGRIRKYLKDKIVWMRPSEIVTAYHDAGGWGFTKNL